MVQRVTELPTTTRAPPRSSYCSQRWISTVRSCRRIVEVLSESGEAGRNSLAKLGSDPLVCGLLVLYGIHPCGTQTARHARHRESSSASREARRIVELIEVVRDVVRVKVRVPGNGCGSSPDALKINGGAGDYGNRTRKWWRSRRGDYLRSLRIRPAQHDSASRERGEKI